MGTSFKFEGRELEYFDHPYNDTRKNERRVELAIALDWLHRTASKRPLLEVGNVLMYYQPAIARWHQPLPTDVVLDKYDKTQGVVNEDAEFWFGGTIFSRILSISTFEHIGVDMPPHEPARGINAVVSIRSMLLAGGKMLATIPVGYNTMLDEDLPRLFGKVSALRRVSDDNRWEECSLKEAHRNPYNERWPRANAILVAEI